MTTFVYFCGILCSILMLIVLTYNVKAPLVVVRVGSHRLVRLTFAVVFILVILVVVIILFLIFIARSEVDEIRIVFEPAFNGDGSLGHFFALLSAKNVS